MGYVSQEVFPVLLQLFQLSDLFGLLFSPHLHFLVQVLHHITFVNCIPDPFLRQSVAVDGFKDRINPGCHKSDKKEPDNQAYTYQAQKGQYQVEEEAGFKSK